MKIDQYKCDVCGELIDDSAPFFSCNLEVEEKKMDSSGNGYIYKYRNIDVCEGCNEEILLKAFNLGKF